MSGGDSSGVGSGFIAQEEECADIKIQVRLSSVDEAVLASVNIHDRLQVQKEDASIVATKDGKIVGAIASMDVVRLKKCIDNGYKYEGIVIEKDDGKCVVRISVIK